MKKKSLIIPILLSVFFLASCDEERDDAVIGDKMGLEYGSYADGIAGGRGLGSGGDGNGGVNEEIEAGQITAGEWNDLAEWDFWRNLAQNEEYVEMPEYWEFYLDNRISVEVKNSADEVVVNAKVELLSLNDDLIWETLTDNSGKAELWSGTSHLNKVKIRVGDNIISNPRPFTEGLNYVVQNASANNTVAHKIDIAFVVDATGSMSDELEYLKVELIDVIDSVKETNSSAIINIGSVFYRDEGDDYVSKKSDFSIDINKTVNFIKAQSANGGGDFPEAVHTALNVAINELQWNSNASSRILFLMLDAPPHYDPQVVSQLHDLIVKASKMGIKIIPITASGIDKETEFLMRFFAISTNGTYVFITGHSGIGGEHLEPTVGEYNVELLNHLLVRLINKHLN